MDDLIKVSEHFSIDDMICPCGCGTIYYDYDLLYRLEVARIAANTAFKINSWCRCPAHNKFVCGQKGSSHLSGLAIDLHTPTMRAKFVFLFHLFNAGFTRFGIGPNFIHVDVDHDKPTPAMWFY